NGFTPWMVPHLVKPEVIYASGQLPKFKGQFYEIEDPTQPLNLIPTAEVPLNGLYMDEVIDEEMLPLKFIAYSPCFRKEAGAAGSQERGLI
ncbi:aminoacyl--tRNA ligase-related protein, partial [Staphylococcus aureus]